MLFVYIFYILVLIKTCGERNNDMAGIFKNEDIFFKVLTDDENLVLCNFIRLYNSYEKAKNRNFNTIRTPGVTTYKSANRNNEVLKYKFEIINYLFQLNAKYDFLNFINKEIYNRVIDELYDFIKTVQLIERMNIY